MQTLARTINSLSPFPNISLISLLIYGRFQMTTNHMTSCTRSSSCTRTSANHWKVLCHRERPRRLHMHIDELGIYIRCYLALFKSERSRMSMLMGIASFRNPLSRAMQTSWRNYRSGNGQRSCCCTLSMLIGSCSPPYLPYKLSQTNRIVLQS